MKDLLGGKGAGLAEMSRLGLNVPPGFTVSTEVCELYSSKRQADAGENDAGAKDALRPVWDEMRRGMSFIEKHMRGRTFGSLGGHARGAKPENTMPLLVSVRSGAAASMPGMMDTVLNLGLNDALLRAAVAAEVAAVLAKVLSAHLTAEIEEVEPGRGAVHDDARSVPLFGSLLEEGHEFLREEEVGELVDLHL